jgi:hypothetical protein
MSETEANPTGGLPTLPTTQTAKGFSFDVAGLPIPMRRTFGALDRLLALPIETLGDIVERKMKVNLESHVEIVQRQRRKKGKKETLEDPSVQTAKVIAEWAAEAGRAGAEDAELTAMWRAILDEIIDGGDDGEELLRIVKSIPTSSIRHFLKLFAEHRRIESLGRVVDATHIDVLRSSGLVRRLFRIEWFRTALYVIVMLILSQYVVPAILAYFPNLIPPISPYGSRLFLPSLVIVSVGFLFLYQLSEPSELGRRLIQLFREYADASRQNID